jgi:hypothetical protein
MAKDEKPEELMTRREFILGLKKWSKVAIGAALIGAAIVTQEKDADAGGWVNRWGGGGGWINGGGGWINRAGGWINGGGGWINGSGGWINRWGGGGGWINR